MISSSSLNTLRVPPLKGHLLAGIGLIVAASLCAPAVKSVAEVVKGYLYEPPTLLESFYKIVGTKAQAVLVYGFNACRYTTICQRLLDSKALQVFSWRLIMNKKSLTKADVLKCSPIKLYKELLNIIIYENVQKAREGISITPILFVIKMEESPWRLGPVTSNKIRRRLRFITYSEMNRARKLCFDLSLPKEMRDIAKRSFFFVETRIRKEGDYYLKAIRSPLDETEFMPNATSHDKTWRTELRKL